MSDTFVSGRLVASRRLVLRQEPWGQALRILLDHSRGWLVAELINHDQQQGLEHIAFDLQWTNTPPVGDARPPLASWLVIGLRHSDEAALEAGALELAERLGPGSLQTLLIVQLDLEHRGRWCGLVHAPQGIEPLDEIRWIGPGMLTVSNLADEDPSEGEGELDLRWSRTAGALGPEVVLRLRQSTVTLIGAGRNGGLMAMQLAALGVGHLRVADADVLKIENCDAMPHVGVNDVGQSKLQALAGRLREFRPEMNLTLLEKRVGQTKTATWLRQRSDLLVTCVDSDTPRLAAATIAARTATVHLDVGSLVGDHRASPQRIAGDARLFLPGEGCVACVGGLADFEASLHELTSPDSLPFRLRTAWNEDGRGGSLISINSMVVGAGVQMWLDLLGGRLTSSSWQRILWNPGRGLEVDSGAVGADPNCRVCRREPLWG